MILFSLVMIVPFTKASMNMGSLTFLGVLIAVFAVSLVALTASMMMYFHDKDSEVTVLKRRGTRVYDELLRHKVLLISAIDGDQPVVRWNHFLYDTEEFPRIKTFLGTEYFLLLNCGIFFCDSKAGEAFNAFRNLHNELSDFMRSVSYDRVECARFRKRYARVMGKEMTSTTPESDFEHEALAEAWEAMQMANEQAMRTIDSILDEIEKYEIAMDKYFEEGSNWETYKKSMEASYQGWLHDNEE